MSSFSSISSSSAPASFPRVLSIQSTVSHGYVGNKCATFPLQCLGFHVDAINTVSLSNHPDYPGGFKGQFLSAEDMANTVLGLQNNDLLSKVDGIVTGYTRSAAVLEAIEAAIIKVKAANPHALYLCDPVLGDNGSFYVPEELVDFYKQRLIPLAYAITPNYFETEVLTGVQVRTISDAKRACAVFHSWGVKIVVLKGLRLADPETGSLTVLLSSRDDDAEQGQGKERTCLLRQDVPRVQGRYSGCGDLFSALTIAGLYRARAAFAARSSSSKGLGHTEIASVLGAVLDGVTGTMSAVVEETQRGGTRELRIIESIERYQSLQRDWDVSRLASLPSSSSGTIASGATANPHRAYIQHSTVTGVVFDMDGTLTETGAINFGNMYTRNGFDKAAGDLLTQVASIQDEAARKRAMDVIIDEELQACDRMVLRPRMTELLDALHSSRIRVALSTRNCLPAYHRFLTLAKLPPTAFSPALSRDCLGGVNKPDPAVARHILAAWGVEEHEASSVWFVGDSEDDMLSGSRAGLRTCLLRTPYNRAFAAAAATRLHGHVTLEVDSLEEFAREALGLDLQL